jgi:hypothetical protein
MIQRGTSTLNSFQDNFASTITVIMSLSESAEPPPPYARTVYDETFRGKYFMEPSIASMANNPNLLAYLEHHAPVYRWR